MTPRDTLNPSVFPNSSSSPVPPDDYRGDWQDLMAAECAKAFAEQSDAKFFHPRSEGIYAAERYLASHEIPETEPPFPWLYLVAVLFIVAVLVAVCALSWDAIAAGVAFLGLAPAAGSSLVAEAGRDAGVVR